MARIDEIKKARIKKLNKPKVIAKGMIILRETFIKSGWLNSISEPKIKAMVPPKLNMPKVGVKLSAIKKIIPKITKANPE